MSGRLPQSERAHGIHALAQNVVALVGMWRDIRSTGASRIDTARGLWQVVSA